MIATEDSGSPTWPGPQRRPRATFNKWEVILDDTLVTEKNGEGPLSVNARRSDRWKLEARIHQQQR